MKKSALVLALFAVMPAFAEDGYGYRYSAPCDDCGVEATQTIKKNSYKKAGKRKSGYNNVINNNFYYIQPAAQQPVQARPVKHNYYTPKVEPEYEEPEYVEVEKKYTKKTYSSKARKYFLAHPFFQPEKGRFGSVTDLGFAHNSFKFDMIDGTVHNMDTTSATYTDPNNPLYGYSSLSGKAETKQLLLKEDISYGITDNLAVIGMVQYDKTDVALKDFSDRTDPTWSVPDKKSSDSGLNLFGLGLQYRFVDNPEWIAMGTAYFQHQKDTANTLVGEVKAGYKIDRTTVYGLGRLGYATLTDGHIYGVGVKYDTNNLLMLSYKSDVDDAMYAEIGAGVFSVLNKYTTLNGEMIYGYYDWHNQLNIKGAIGFQPNDMFALNLYAMTSLYDSANNKTLKYFSHEFNPTDFPKMGNTPMFTDSNYLYTEGDYKLKDYREWKIGVQAILYF